jgi:hypothetical protein
VVDAATQAPAAPEKAPETPETTGALDSPTETPPAADAPEEALQLAAINDPLQGSRPKNRPSAIDTAAAKAASDAKAEAEAAAKAEADARLAAEAEAQRFAGASAQAVETSRRPNSKPSNFASAVESAVAAAVASAAPSAPAAVAPAAVAPAAVAPAPAAPQTSRSPSPAPAPTIMNAPKSTTQAAVMDELDEPEPVAPTRGGPTTRTVASQATEKNAISMGKMNLIGLFGAKGNRRGLVRMPNGSFVRVQVGDRLDGGTVTAIGDGQLSYQKGSRNTTLTLLAGG